MPQKSFGTPSARRINYSYEYDCHYLDLCNSRCPDWDLRARSAFYFIKKHEKEQGSNEGSPGCY